MAGITLEKAEEHLAYWLNIDAKLGQRPDAQHSENGRTFTLADRGEVRENIKFWNEQCRILGRGGLRVQHVIPL